MLRLAYTGRTAAAREALGRCRDAVEAAASATSPAGTDDGPAGSRSSRARSGGRGPGPDVALAALRSARDLAAAGGNRYLGGVARSAATALLARHGDPAAVRDDVAEVLTWWRGPATARTSSRRNLLVLLARAGDDATAATLWGTVVAADGVPVAYGTERDRLEDDAHHARRPAPGRSGSRLSSSGCVADEQAADDVAGGPSRHEGRLDVLTKTVVDVARPPGRVGTSRNRLGPRRSLVSHAMPG